MRWTPERLTWRSRPPPGTPCGGDPGARRRQSAPQRRTSPGRGGPPSRPPGGIGARAMPDVPFTPESPAPKTTPPSAGRRCLEWRIPQATPRGRGGRARRGSRCPWYATGSTMPSAPKAGPRQAGQSRRPKVRLPRRQHTIGQAVPAVRNARGRGKSGRTPPTGFATKPGAGTGWAAGAPPFSSALWERWNTRSAGMIGRPGPSTTAGGLRA